MWQAYENQSIPASVRRPIVTLGVFDGVHRGHQRVLRQTLRWARQRQVQAIVVTFRDHPQKLLTQSAPPQLTSLEHRLILFERLGMDGCLVLQFGRRLAAMSADQFVERILLDRLGAGGVVLGFDSRFGRGAEGGVELLRRYQAAGRLDVRQSSQLMFRGRPVSSTAVRDAILAGRLSEARRMLGRRVAVFGTVVHGDGRGRLLGYPTANLDLHHEVRPPSGVYLTWTLLDGRRFPSVCSIGPRPTFEPPSRPGTVEVHLLGFRRAIYGRNIEVQFICRLRDQLRLEGTDALKTVIARDIERAVCLFRRLRE